MSTGPAKRSAILLLLALLAQGAAAELPRVRLDTALGDIFVEVDTEAAPITAGHFLALVEAGAYDDGAFFYRAVTPENQPTSPVRIQVIQGGRGRDRSDAVPRVAHETTEDTGLRHLDGVISMARLAPGTASSEFFFCIEDQPELDFGGRRNPDGQGFAAFGRVVSGMDVVRAIQALPTRPRPADGEDFDGQQLLEPVRIERVALDPGP
ncbi:MAG: peptidylprolyl isomerase [Pseudomonadales bacterium]|jgi:peptidyl-prolyl cis-trans isomerase A (cyclophilin A)|nr:peptidylprolyl isomerase [Pseudomonadales bacterium]